MVPWFGVIDLETAMKLLGFELGNINLEIDGQVYDLQRDNR